MLEEPVIGSKQVPLQITEDEAAVYDRQIRLWGLEAQQRMRNATTLIVNLKGVATETIKNIVLAGIGKLIIIDDQDVTEEDLGAGFLFREEDVGKKRVDAARVKIESLNPMVTIETVASSEPIEAHNLTETLQNVDLVCITDSTRDTLLRVNSACRNLKKPFYAGGSYGLIGYIFCDLIDHEYLTSDASDQKDPNKRVKKTTSYCPLETALKPYSWGSLSRVQTKELNPALVFTVLAIWEFQSRHGKLPDDGKFSQELHEIARSLFTEADIHKRVLTEMPQDLLQSIATTAAHEFSPVCAVIGGMLAQDILKALGGQEPPIANFFFFDGNTGHGSVCRMNM